MSRPSTSRPKTRLLFFAEAVTLAHVARPVALAQALDEQLFDVHLAHHPRYRQLLGDLAFSEHEINSISPQQFIQALAGGKPLYDVSTLSSYVGEDLRVIDAVKPDIIVGDFRLSLAVSAELAGVPYIALSNAYWSSYCEQQYVVPDLPITRTLGPALAQPLFSLVRPLAFALHCRPMNKVRRRYGLPSLGYDLGEVYTHADYTLYADAPDLYRMRRLPLNHRFIGPIVWSPEFPRPDWWQSLPSERPIVYVTLGSSGPAGLLPMLLETLGSFNVTALVSTAGAPVPSLVPENVHVASYLPGEDAVKMASLVICNGGSPTTHQALSQGVPVVGLPSNLDQYLNMAAIEKSGAGQCLRAGSCEAKALHSVISRVLDDAVTHAAARRLAVRFTEYDSAIEFQRIIKQIGEHPERRRQAGKD